MTKLTSTLAMLAALGLAAPAAAQTSTSASVDATVSTSVDATTSTSAEPSSSTAPDSSASSAPSTTTTTDASVNITTEQKTEIHQAITEINVQPAANISFDINIGVAVPKTVVLTPLPARIIKIFPHYKGFMFFLLADGRIVIVDPSSLKIVLIIVA